MFRRLALAATLVLAGLVALPLAAVAAEPVKIAFHVDENDPARLNLVLNNLQNVAKHYAAEGREVRIEVVAYGPGLDMLVAGKSPVAERISAMAMELQGVAFAACADTMDAVERKTGTRPELLPEAVVVPSGVVRLVELQEDGWAHVRP